MKIMLEDISSETMTIEQELPVSGFAPHEGVLTEEPRVVSPVRVKAELVRSGEDISVRGTVETYVELNCCRCLEKFRYVIDTDIDIVYEPACGKRRESTVGAGELTRRQRERGEELSEDDLNIVYYTEPVICLGDHIREAIYLAIPMKPLCREECQGLCPQCGQNLNIRSCRCVSSSIDPGFSELKKLLEPEGIQHQDKNKAMTE